MTVQGRKAHGLLGLVILLLIVFIVNFSSFAMEEVTLRAPIPPSQYSPDYTENDFGQIEHSINFGVFKTRRYNVYQPFASKMVSEKKRGAVVLLHGAGRGGASVIEMWRPVADRNDLILIAPHSSGRWDLRTDGAKFIPAMLDETIETYNIDPRRVYLFGHSMGGRFSYYLATLLSHRFAAASAHAGQFNSVNDYTYVANAKRKIPFISIVGTHDHIFSVKAVRGSTRAYSNHGHDAKLVILDQHNHWYYTIAGYINDQAWEFMRDYTLDE